MTKSISATALDETLNYLKNNGTELVILSQAPANYTEAHTTYMLASITIDSSDFTLGNGDVSGRKVTVGAQSGTVTNSGTATHYAVLDNSNSAVLLVSTCTSQALTAANPIDTPAFKYESNQPT